MNGERSSFPKETLIVSKNDEGFRVYSPVSPLKSYIVSGSPEKPRCSCPDFEHAGRCKHIAAVLEEMGFKPIQPDPYEQEERLAIQNESLPSEKETPASRPLPQMLIKRSVSPDGRIDSLSVEFTCSVDEKTLGEIKSRAQRTLQIQSEIIKGFLHDSKNSNDENGGDNGNGNQSSAANGSIPAKMLSIAGFDSKWGRRLFISIEANGNTFKLFGAKKQLSEAIASAGFPHLAERIEERVQLNLPCRITTKPSEDGKYMNVDQVFPLNGKERR